jgi:peptidoglycan/LPS O-acetylase OafA/YrhL
VASARFQRAQPYVAAFDGLRALAVVAVVAYHASMSFAPGGFFGVDVFFVISGYLITALLLDRAAEPGASEIIDFWRRRLLRLVPAALGAVAATFAIFALLQVRGPGTLAVEAASALGYVANWVWVIRDQSYFETSARPSPFLHFWSLAVEAQFYLVWPLLIALALRAGGRLTLLLVTLSLASISIVVGAALYDPLGDPSRAYYGTDARAAGLLIGAALGVVARPGLRGLVKRPLVEVCGWFGLAGLAWLFTQGSEFHAFTYRGGFLVASAATLGVMLAALHGRNSISALLSIAPLRWIGLRSYSIYLWHWPVVVLTHPHMSSALQSWNLAVARFAVTIILAEVSYRLVEHRFRSGRAAAAERGTPEWWRRPLARRLIARMDPRVGVVARSPWAPPGAVLAAALVAIVIAGGLPIRTGSADFSIPVAHVAGFDFSGDGIQIEQIYPASARGTAPERSSGVLAATSLVSS